MAIPRWYPIEQYTRLEERMAKRSRKMRRLFWFLRDHRRELFDNEFQAELETMYRNTGAGLPPIAPALIAMAVILQGYVGASDAEAVELTVMDLRWQMVLERLGKTEPALSVGALHAFRQRMIKHDMDRRLLERTVELARKTGDFDAKKLPKSLRVGIDSAPLEGAGRVEDTFNLLGHAARSVVACVAVILGWEVERVCREAGIPLLLEISIKKGLDIEWSAPEAKAKAMRVLVKQLKSLQAWVGARLHDDARGGPLGEVLDTLRQLIEQDLEPDPDDGGLRIRQGTAPDRRVSVRDSQMRHGRKSKSRRFNGYKRHIAADLDAKLILACAITPANVPEQQAATPLAQDVERQGRSIDELYIDRAYINCEPVDQIRGRGGEVLCKPWVARNANKGAFTKAEFGLTMRDMTITCPAGRHERIQPGTVVEFEPEQWERCPLRPQGTMASAGCGKTVSIAGDEKEQHRLRKLVATSKGRARLRLRTGVEHRLAHLVRRQGRRARYLGVRKNLFYVRRASAIQNLEAAQRNDKGVRLVA